jgi:4-hydroxybenzoate polyprenyltransferase
LSYVGLGAFAVYLVWQVRKIDISDSAHCLMLFKSNRDAGLILFAGYIADAASRHVF